MLIPLQTTVSVPDTCQRWNSTFDNWHYYIKQISTSISNLASLVELSNWQQYFRILRHGNSFACLFDIILKLKWTYLIIVVLAVIAVIATLYWIAWTYDLKKSEYYFSTSSSFFHIYSKQMFSTLNSTDFIQVHIIYISCSLFSPHNEM